MLVVFLLAAGSLQAQSGLVITPQTLRYPADEIVTITNPSAVAVSLDSLVIAFAGLRAWYFQLRARDTLLSDTGISSEYIEGLCRADFVCRAELLPGTEVAAEDTLQIHFTGLDPCIVCSAFGKIDSADTLLVYARSQAFADTVILDLSLYVSTEPDLPPASALDLSLYPNPAHSILSLEVNTGSSLEAQLTLYDLQGRLIRNLGRARSTSRPRIDLGRVAPGAYFVRLSTPEGAMLTRVLTVVR